MNTHIPKWVIAAFVGAAPMLGLVFFILFSCTLLGLVQRCKISLSKSYGNRRKNTMLDRSSIENEDDNTIALFNPKSNMVIVSPFDDIPMKDIDAESSKAYSETKDGAEFIYYIYIYVFFSI
ncbi:unnamed protein product [Adineta steineri]|uniref:Uncharacterized protein n=1 Tax=Adineta steineri TaxID=433720 RepID=A0A818MEI1_9BILA|nr:unnamed protein product [Adineta steineri]